MQSEVSFLEKTPLTPDKVKHLWSHSISFQKKINFASEEENSNT